MTAKLQKLLLVSVVFGLFLLAGQLGISLTWHDGPGLTDILDTGAASRYQQAAM